jgi:hypothetical protein
MANVGKLVMSVPYIDFDTGVSVLTICRTITSSVDRSRPLAVMCVDMLLDTFAKELSAAGSCTHPVSPDNLDGQCMLVNDGGYFVWHAELLAQAQNASVTDTLLTLHVGRLYPNVRVCPRVDRNAECRRSVGWLLRLALDIMGVQVSTIMSSIGTTHQCDDLVANKQRNFSTIVLDNPVALRVAPDCTVHVVPVPLVQLSLLQFSGKCASQRSRAGSPADGTSNSTTPLAGDACMATVRRNSSAFCPASVLRSNGQPPRKQTDLRLVCGAERVSASCSL